MIKIRKEKTWVARVYDMDAPASPMVIEMRNESLLSLLAGLKEMEVMK